MGLGNGRAPELPDDEQNDDGAQIPDPGKDGGPPGMCPAGERSCRSSFVGLSVDGLVQDRRDVRRLLRVGRSHDRGGLWLGPVQGRRSGRQRSPSPLEPSPAPPTGTGSTGAGGAQRSGFDGRNVTGSTGRSAPPGWSRPPRGRQPGGPGRPRPPVPQGGPPRPRVHEVNRMTASGRPPLCQRRLEYRGVRDWE